MTPYYHGIHRKATQFPSPHMLGARAHQAGSAGWTERRHASRWAGKAYVTIDRELPPPLQGGENLPAIHHGFRWPAMRAALHPWLHSLAPVGPEMRKDAARRQVYRWDKSHPTFHQIPWPRWGREYRRTLRGGMYTGWINPTYVSANPLAPVGPEMTKDATRRQWEPAIPRLSSPAPAWTGGRRIRRRRSVPRARNPARRW
jgi:hypothetical protein